MGRVSVIGADQWAWWSTTRVRVGLSKSNLDHSIPQGQHWPRVMLSLKAYL